MLVHSLAGLGFGLSLIVAIGAQNMFVLRQGLRREHVGVVVAICAVSDALLISAGVAGAGQAAHDGGAYAAGASGDEGNLLGLGLGHGSLLAG